MGQTIEVLVDTFLPHSAGEEMIEGELTGKHLWEKIGYERGSLVDSDDLAPDYVALLESGERSVRATVRFVDAEPDAEPRVRSGSGKPADIEVHVDLDIPQSGADGNASIPRGYKDLKVDEIKVAVKTWEEPQIQAALVFERSKDNRKSAIKALEEALVAKEVS